MAERIKVSLVHASCLNLHCEAQVVYDINVLEMLLEYLHRYLRSLDSSSHFKRVHEYSDYIIKKFESNKFNGLFTLYVLHSEYVAWER